MLGSTFFQSYHRTLHRVLFAEMIDDFQNAHCHRRLSIVGPCFTHEQWLAAQSERRARLRLMSETADDSVSG